jgi:uncharacterized protein YbjT (DUF2867 family)
MPDVKHALLITGASGRLGQAVVSLATVSEGVSVVAASGSPAKLAAFESRNVTLREANFDQHEHLVATFTGVER